MPNETNEKCFECSCEWFLMDRATAIVHIKEMHGGSYTYKDVSSFKVALATLLVPPLWMTRSETAALVLD